jgi:hypothetical protein
MPARTDRAISADTMVFMAQCSKQCGQHNCHRSLTSGRIARCPWTACSPRNRDLKKESFPQRKSSIPSSGSAAFEKTNGARHLQWWRAPWGMCGICLPAKPLGDGLGRRVDRAATQTSGQARPELIHRLAHSRFRAPDRASSFAWGSRHGSPFLPRGVPPVSTRSS